MEQLTDKQKQYLIKNNLSLQDLNPSQKMYMRRLKQLSSDIGREKDNERSRLYRLQNKDKISLERKAIYLLKQHNIFCTCT
jgi:hypothetical protein